MKKIGAIILAGGKGKRMKMKDSNKVTVTLGNKPMIKHIVEFMHKLQIETIVVVVGFARSSVVDALKGYNIIFADQKKRLGTGHAVLCAVRNLPKDVEHVLVVYGDDAVLYTEKHLPIIQQLFSKHFDHASAMTFLTIMQENPVGLGRIVRSSNGRIQAIVEEKDATEEQRKIKEINPGCFVFSVSFLRKYLQQVEKSSATGEYYLTSLIDIAIKHNELVETVQGGYMAWRGVNTYEELQQAEKLYMFTHTE
jgi:bifunctional UDP-N-acetylglucosamine pyrophosphorylase/glucosamine-1-phosphate N-acetyltransferase